MFPKHWDRKSHIDIPLMDGHSRVIIVSILTSYTSLESLLIIVKEAFIKADSSANL